MKGKEILKVIYVMGLMAKDVLNKPVFLLDKSSEETGKALVILSDRL